MTVLLVWIISIIIGLVSAKFLQLQTPDLFVSKNKTNWKFEDYTRVGTGAFGLCLIAPVVAALFSGMLLLVILGKIVKWLFYPKSSIKTPASLDYDEEDT